MPTYDVECSGCGYSSVTVNMKISTLAQWDLNAICPACQSNATHFSRVIKQAPARNGVSQSMAHQLASNKSAFIRSGESDAMRHAATKRVNQDDLAAGLESVRRGEFEGF